MAAIPLADLIPAAVYALSGRIYAADEPEAAEVPIDSERTDAQRLRPPRPAVSPFRSHAQVAVAEG